MKRLFAACFALLAFSLFLGAHHHRQAVAQLPSAAAPDEANQSVMPEVSLVEPSYAFNQCGSASGTVACGALHSRCLAQHGEFVPYTIAGSYPPKEGCYCLCY